MLKIRFFGDFCANFDSSNLEIDKDLLEADLNIINLETPIVQYAKAARKCGPHLTGNKDNFINVASQFIHACSFMLANNHIADFGEEGILETLSILNNDYSYTGISSLPDILYQDLNEIKIAIINICEEQYGAANYHRTGPNSLSEKIYSLIVEAKNNSDFVIISIHAGAEMCPYPSPKLQNLYRSFIDIGADFIHGHHSHIPQGFEKYKEKYIFYGLGNFCVNFNNWEKEGKLCTYSLSPFIKYENKQFTVQFDIIEQINNKIYIEQNNTLNNYLKLINIPLTDEKLLYSFWQYWSLKIYHEAFDLWLSHKSINNKYQFFKTIIRQIVRVNNTENLINKDQLLLQYHLWSCTSHQEAIKMAIGILSDEIFYDKNIEFNKLLIQYPSL